jgi:AcrR family transcriptional regulator
VQAFGQQGFHRTSISDIARTAGISKALIYEHFASKQALRSALVETHVSEISARLAATAATSQPGEARLRAGVDAFFAYVEENRHAWKMLFRDAADPEVLAILERTRALVSNLVATLIASDPTRPDPHAHPQAIAMLAEMLTGALQALANWWSEHQEIPRQQLTDTAIDFAWFGLQRIRAGERTKPRHSQHPRLEIEPR